MRLDAGVYVAKDFGNDDYSESEITFSLKIPEQQLQFYFRNAGGGSLHHRLIEPLYDFERAE